jgi:hypothetical protein
VETDPAGRLTIDVDVAAVEWPAGAGATAPLTGPTAPRRRDAREAAVERVAAMACDLLGWLASAFAADAPLYVTAAAEALREAMGREPTAEDLVAAFDLADSAWWVGTAHGALLARVDAVPEADRMAMARVSGREMVAARRPKGEP